MEEELRKIFDKNNFGFGEIDVDNAIKDILRLFNVRRCVLCKSPTSSSENHYCDGCLSEEDYR